MGYGYLACIVRHRPGTLIFRRHDLTIIEGVRFRVEADGYEPFDFAPVDPQGKPLAFETWDPPVFRVALRRDGASGVPVSWSTRPELKLYEPWFPGRSRNVSSLIHRFQSGRRFQVSAFPCSAMISSRTAPTSRNGSSLGSLKRCGA